MTAPTQLTRRLTAAAALGCLPALAACGAGGSPSAVPTVTRTVTAPAPATVATTAPAPSSSPAAGSGPGPCPTSGLRARIGLTQGAAGSAYAVIDFTNVSGSACTMYGYPGVSFVSGRRSGIVVGAPAGRTSPPSARLVTLAPGGVASSLLRITDAGAYPPARCHAVSVSWMQIFPPDQTAALHLFYATTVCAKPVVTVHVNVVVPGSGGSA